MARDEKEKSTATGQTPPRQAVASAARAGSICVTCNMEPGCVHLLRNPGLLVWDCENFDDHVEPAVPSRTVAPDVGAKAEEYEGRTGLCMNCAEWRVCSYRRPSGGVWHCSEYRV